ncbi:tetratricopeptide repeat 28-like [Paramuricea clavata]|uniref:Tetratricopeptide repeat 28-like n=1 Tax=Paramuricea clavata TaxID=317549 RepID=A0A7D9D7Z5_PARCT|nr:tetratricopeptide repeat 28-like [Paramuricea clavata]
MDEDIDVSVAVRQLKEGRSDPSRQVRPLLKLADWHLRKSKETANGADFTKANALYNAALVRSELLNYEVGEDQIIRGIVETYRTFLSTFTNDEDVGVDEIRNEIRSHKEFLAKERKIFKDRLEHQYEIHTDMIYDVFRDIQDMYTRLVSMLVKECEGRLGQPPCDYAMVAMGSVARMEATPFSDLEFAILYADPAIGDKISYFRVLTHFLHLKVINLGETILPALGIEQLNDFQSSAPDGSWFYDSDTPPGISFDGAMPWASKTPLGRMATEDKPALELIKTPEDMAELQDEEISLKEGYHLADILLRVALLYGKRALLDEYNERVAEKLNTKSSAAKGNSTKTVGFIRGIQQMILDIETYHPQNCYLGVHCAVGGLFDAKKEFYRLISLLLSDLGLIFDIRSPSPWRVIMELWTRGIIDETEKNNIKECLSIANEIRLKAYFAYNRQK